MAPVGSCGDGVALTPCLVRCAGPDRGALLGVMVAGPAGCPLEPMGPRGLPRYKTTTISATIPMILATTEIAILGRRQRDSEVDDSATARTRSSAEIISEDEGSTASLGRISPAPIDGVARSRGGSECSACDSADLSNCDANPSSGPTRNRSIESSNCEDSERDSRGISAGNFERVFSVFLLGEIA